jgi:23S rRNA (adenine2503-C2)-methyltransferase
MPVERLNPIVEVSRLIKQYQSMHNRKLTLEYTLLKGVNDSKKQIDGLINVAKYLNAKINLINLNPHSKIPFEPVSSITLNSIMTHIKSASLSVTVRYRKGQDIAAACGQLGESILNK